MFVQDNFYFLLNQLAVQIYLLELIVLALLVSGASVYLSVLELSIPPLLLDSVGPMGIERARMSDHGF